MTAVASLERESRQDKDGSKVSSLTFRPVEVPTDLLLEWQHKESTRIPNYTLQTKQVGVHTALESHNCAATSDQSSIPKRRYFQYAHFIPIVSPDFLCSVVSVYQPLGPGVIFSSLPHDLHTPLSEILTMNHIYTCIIFTLRLKKSLVFILLYNHTTVFRNF